MAADFGRSERIGSVPRVNVRRLNDLWSLIRKSDLVLIGGGTLLQDDQRDRCFAGLPRLCLAVSVIGWLCNRRIVYFGVGCDPIIRPHMRNILRIAVFGRRLFVREEESLARVRTELNSNGQVSCDASLLLYPWGKDLRLPRAKEARLTICLNSTESQMLTVERFAALDKIFERVGFLSMDQGDSSDFHGLNPAVRSMMEPHQLDYTWRDAAAKIEASTLVISSRMHALYLAGLLNVPSIAVGNSPKVASFAKRYGIPIVEDLADFIECPQDLSLIHI